MEPHSCGQVSQLPKSSQWQVIFRPWRVDRLTWQVLYVNSTVRFFCGRCCWTVNCQLSSRVKCKKLIHDILRAKTWRFCYVGKSQQAELLSHQACRCRKRSAVRLAHRVSALQYRIVFLEMLPKAPKSKHSTRKGFAFFFCWIEMAFSGTMLVFWACGGACMYGFLLRVWSFQSTGFWQEKCMQDSNFHHTKTHPAFLTPMDPPFQHPKTKPCRLRYGFELAIKSSESDDPRRFNTPPVH